MGPKMAKMQLSRSNRLMTPRWKAKVLSNFSFYMFGSVQIIKAQVFSKGDLHHIQKIDVAIY